jgi:hypothetical protein
MWKLKSDAVRWRSIAMDSRFEACEKDYEFSKEALQVAGLCEHIAEALESISNILDSVHGCHCGECPKPNNH